MQALEQMRIAGRPVKAIIHVGANDGQERYEYQAADVPVVIYVEPISVVYERLVNNVSELPGHVPVRALCTASSGQTVTINISSNDGHSSSILPLGHHAELFPHISYCSHEDLESITVDDLLRDLNPSAMPNLMVIDTQGSELDVLKGAIETLRSDIEGVFVEVSEEPLYENGCTQAEISEYLSGFGFRLRWVFINGMGHGDAFYLKVKKAQDAQKVVDLSIVEALALLKPFDIDLAKRRVGPEKDGGYVMIPALFARQPVFSYGINGEYNFDIEMAAGGHKIFMFDHTIDGISNPTSDPNLCWIKEGVDGRHDADRLLNTIENHLIAYADGASDVILKMDVEGYEFDSFDALPPDQLARFQQIVFEVHDLHHLYDADYRRRFVRVFTKINSLFTLFHVHANNFDGENTYNFLDGIPVSNLLELSYVRHDLVERRPSKTLYPTALDFPNVHPMDKKLWFFPFLPTDVDDTDFAAAARRMAVTAGRA